MPSAPDAAGRARTYLDHAATAPPTPAVLDVLARLGHAAWGNASSVHAEGRAARAVMDEARADLADALGTDEDEIVFTGSGSEADNIAIRGTAWLAPPGSPACVVTSLAEHEAVLRTCKWLESRGEAEVTWLSPDQVGALAPRACGEALRGRAGLVTLLAVNNETGVRLDVEAVADECERAGATLHVDAVQLLGRTGDLACLRRAGLVTLSAHKVGGPKGCGALVVRRGTKLHPALTGGGQEGGLRPGTENVAVVAAGALALAAAARHGGERAERLAGLTRVLEAELRAMPGAWINGEGAPRVPGIVNAGFEGADAGALVQALDLAGFAVSAGSACASGSTRPSHVLSAMGQDPRRARAAIRVSPGEGTSEEDLRAFAGALRGALARAAGAAR